MTSVMLFGASLTAQQAEKRKTNPATEPRAWTSADGQFSTHAQLVTFVGDEVVLKKDDGKTVKVLIENISIADRNLVRGLRTGKFKNVIVGRIDDVMDGDTLLLIDGAGEKHTIRLQGIDAPEDTQPGGKESCKLLKEKIENATVHVAWYENDKYERVLGQVFVGDTWVNRDMVSDGWAWHYLEYSDDKELAAAEKKARASRVGLWATDNPMPPWEFRHTLPDDTALETPTTGQKPLGLLGSGNDESPKGIANSQPPEDKARGSKANPSEKPDNSRTVRNEKDDRNSGRTPSVTVYVTKTGEKYHRAGCRYLKKSSIPIDLESAKARYSPCSVCNPPN